MALAFSALTLSKLHDSIFESVRENVMDSTVQSSAWESGGVSCSLVGGTQKAEGRRQKAGYYLLTSEVFSARTILLPSHI